MDTFPPHFLVVGLENGLHYMGVDFFMGMKTASVKKGMKNGMKKRMKKGYEKMV